MVDAIFICLPQGQYQEGSAAAFGGPEPALDDNWD